MSNIIVVAGMISAGKTSFSEMMGEELGSKVFYEPVEDNPFLEKFYTASDKEKEENRYPFLLQLYFLGMRFKMIKKAYQDSNNILDRSIYEDWYFAKVNKEIGDISEEEFYIYESLLENMMEEIETLPQKAPDLLVYLHGPFDLIMERIVSRGREFEQDEELVNYYYKLWSGYDDWVENHYDASDVLRIDISQYDFVNNKEDERKVKQIVLDKLAERE